MAQLFGDNDTESTKRHDFDFAKSTFVAEIDTRQGGMRKLITHVSFVHWWDAHYYYQLTARGRKREWKTRVTSKPATSFRYKCRCLQCNSVLHDETLITSSRRKKKDETNFYCFTKNVIKLKKPCILCKLPHSIMNEKANVYARFAL